MTQLPQSVVFELTYACNHACPFCSCPWEAEGAERGMELSIDDWKKAALEFIGHGVRNIILSGGEPLLKEGIGDLLGFLAFQLRAAYGIHYDLQLSTNGTLLTREMLHLLKDCNATLCTSLPSLHICPSQGTCQPSLSCTHPSLPSWPLLPLPTVPWLLGNQLWAPPSRPSHSHFHGLS